MVRANENPEVFETVWHYSCEQGSFLLLLWLADVTYAVLYSLQVQQQVDTRRPRCPI